LNNIWKEEKMLFQIVHSHTNTDCPAQSAENAKRSSEWWQSFKATSGVRVVGGYVAPLDHTFYITVEAENYLTLSKALGPLLGIGTGHVSPVLTLDETFPMVEAGAFRGSK
jgi:hypothetical protein